MKVYHISDKKQGNIRLEPRIPDNFMTRNGYEDKSVKRVCVSKTIDGSLKAMSMNLKGKQLHVYSADVPDADIYKPKKSEVPDAFITNELWIEKPISMRYEKSIDIGEAKDREYTYTYGNNKASLYGWNFNESSPMGKRNNAHISKIQSAGASQTMLAIKYKDRKGNLSQRVVEPYKLIGNDFWAFDPEKENIRRFKVKNFKSIKSTNKKYEARWPIEIGGNEMIKTSEFMDYLIEKVAGVEYGYNVYNDKSGKISDQLSQSSLSGDYDKEESIREKLKMKGPNDYGFPKWSEKTIASAPFEYDVTELTDFMNGKDTNKLKHYRPMLNPYSGKDDGQNFLAGRESAEKMVKMYGDLLSKMPEGEKFSKADYDKAVNEYNSFKSVIDGRRSKNEEAVKAERSKWVDSTSKLDAKKSEWDKKNPLIKMVNIPGRMRHNSEVKNIRQESNNHFLNMHKFRNKGISKEDLGQLNTLRDNMYKGSGRNTVELYRDSLSNSLKDKKNNMYEWGWS